MTYLSTLVFPFLSLASAVAVVIALFRYVAQIRREIRESVEK